MNTQNQAILAKDPSVERNVSAISGWPMLVINIALVGLGVFLIARSIYEVEALGREFPVLKFIAALLFLGLGILLLMRLSPKGGWISRWSLAFIVGITAGLNIVRYLQSDFIVQVHATMVTLLPDWQGFGHFFGNLSLSIDGPLVQTFSTWVVFFGTFCGLVYFFFSKEHKGWFGRASRVGIWVLMVTFGAGFGYTVMARISLLIGRLEYLGNWIQSFI